MANSYGDPRGGKPSDQGRACLPVHGVHKLDLVVQQGRFAGDHGSPEVCGLANVAVVLMEESRCFSPREQRSSQLRPCPAAHLPRLGCSPHSDRGDGAAPPFSAHRVQSLQDHPVALPDDLHHFALLPSILAFQDFHLREDVRVREGRSSGSPRHSAPSEALTVSPQNRCHSSSEMGSTATRRRRVPGGFFLLSAREPGRLIP